MCVPTLSFYTFGRIQRINLTRRSLTTFTEGRRNKPNEGTCHACRNRHHHRRTRSKNRTRWRNRIAVAQGRLGPRSLVPFTNFFDGMLSRVKSRASAEHSSFMSCAILLRRHENRHHRAHRLCALPPQSSQMRYGSRPHL